MNYTDQQAFFAGSKLWSALVVLLFLVAGAWSLMWSPGAGWLVIATFFVVLIAVAISLVYTPDYLHLTAYPKKRSRWATRVGWPMIAAVFVLGLPFCTRSRNLVALLLSVGWLAVANLLTDRAPARFRALYVLCMDFLLLNILVLNAHLSLLIAGALLAAAAHLCIVISEKRALTTAMATSFLGMLILFEGMTLIALGSAVALPTPPLRQFLAIAAPLFVSAFGTAFLVSRAMRQNRQNVAPVMAGLVEFTGYTHDRIEQLMATSDAELAAKWKTAKIPEDDAARMAEWYRENSELYLFALVAFNLDYKRIRYFLRILPLATGSCLDYGAGNGELLIELARRGHPMTYYDVDGLTMKYARFRAHAENLEIAFFSDKQALATAAQPAVFDTIFSLDVLEHLPDLAGELGFLTSLLSPNGSLIFNLPPGSTKTHPMHLTHDLDVRRFLTEKGLQERSAARISKDEMYIFARS